MSKVAARRAPMAASIPLLHRAPSILAHKFFEVSMENRTRGHGYKLYKKRTGVRMNRFFSARVVNPWNDLDERTVTADTVDKFKRQLSEFG